MRIMEVRRLRQGPGVALMTEDGTTLLGSPEAGQAWLCEANEAERVRVLETRNNNGQLARMLELAITEHPEPATGGRPRSASWYADRIVADTKDLKVQTIRAARMQARRAEGVEDDQPPLATLGQALGAEWTEPVSKVQYLSLRAVTGLSRARAALTEALGTGDVPAAKFERIRDELDKLAAGVKSLVPRSLCPACKSLEGYVDGCATCLGCGWVGDRVGPDSLPDELFDEGRTCVLKDGEVVDLTPVDNDDDFGGL